MNELTPPRPDPDALRTALKKEEERSKKAKLKISSKLLSLALKKEGKP